MNNNNDKKVVDYFAIVGLNKNELDLYPDITIDATHLNYKRDPLVDLIIIDKALNEQVPEGYECITTTPYGHSANLHGNSKSHELYLCYKRGRELPPITDIGVLYEGKERLIDGCDVIKQTLSGASANLNTNTLTGQHIFVTFRRATDKACNILAAIDICVIIKSKDEVAPHSFNEIPKNLNTNIFGASIFLCYKKALIPANQIKYLPKVLFRYPQNDLLSYKFPLQVATFGLPMGALIECWPANIAGRIGNSYPIFSTFVLNVNDDGANITKIYGACATFYEDFNENDLNEEQSRLLNYEFNSKSNVLKTNKCILLLSKHPFFESFRKFLFFLHKLCYYNVKTTIPIERYISHFLNNIPFPTAQKPRVLLHLTKDDEVSIYLPDESSLPQSGASFVELLKCLGAENSINVLLYVLLQKSVMLHSLTPAVITGVVEAVSCIIFPFLWNYAYIPMLPLSMWNMMDAPGSFIFGMDSRYFDMFEPPSNVICVDLDTNSISWTEDRKNLNSSKFPKRAVQTLRNRLNNLYKEIQELIQTKRGVGRNGTNVRDIEVKIKKQERHLELSIREAFLRFMAALLNNYKAYLRTGTRRPDIKAKDRNLLTYYDVDAFIRSRENSSQQFYKELVRTQLFNDFIINISFLTDLDAGLAEALLFFDHCCNRITASADRDDIRLLDAFNNDQTVVVLPPEPLQINGEVKEFTYNGLNELNLTYFEDDLKDLLDNSAKQDNDSSFKSNSLNISSRNNTRNNLLDISAGPNLLNDDFSRRLQNTPIGVRSKQEKLQAQLKYESSNNQYARSAKTWSYCLLSNTYALWFIYLPVYIESSETKVIGLNNAFKVLVKMQKQLLTNPDEICYRVFMQLCSIYKLPTLAVKTLLHMRKYKIEPNHITKSYYNKAIIEGEWPKFDRWGKLRLLISIIKAFKVALKERQQRLAKLNSKNNRIKNKAKLSPNKSKTTSNKKISKSGKTSNTNNNNNNKTSNDLKASNKLNNSLNNKSNNNPSCSSRSQSITCSLSSIADQDKSSIDKISRESGDSGACLNGDNCSHKNYPNSIECFNGSIDIDIKTVNKLHSKDTNGDGVVVKRIQVNHEASKTNTLDPKGARTSKVKSKDLAQIKKNRQLFDSKFKSQKSIVKRQSSIQVQNVNTPFSNSICLISTGILLTNNLNETDFSNISVSKKRHSSNINNTTINSNNTDASVNSINNLNNSQAEIATMPTSLRRYQSDDSIFAKRLIKLIDNNNNKKHSNRKSFVNETTSNSKNKEENKAAVEANKSSNNNNNSKMKEAESSSNTVADPLGAYLLKSNILSDPLSAFATAPNNEKKPNEENNDKFEKLFNYEPFRAEREEEEKKSLQASSINESVSHNYHESEQYSYNDENLDDEYSDEDDDVDDYIVEEDEDEDIDENEDDVEEQHEDEDAEEEEGGEDEEEEAERADTHSTSNNILLAKLTNTENPLLNKFKGAFFDSLNKVSTKMELSNKFKDVTHFTANKLITIKSSIQTNLPNSLSQQEITNKLKSISGYTLNTNLIKSTLTGGNNSSNSLNNSFSNGYQNKQNSLKHDNKSADSLSQISNDGIEMPEAYDIEDIFEYDSNELKNILISVEISSCNRCKSCENLLFDEDIMSLWSSNDSDLNILCIYCKIPQVPNLYIRVKDFGINKFFNQAKSNDRKSQIQISITEDAVPYLSPLVLRKEIENIVSNEGLNIDAKFMEDHKLIFWNLMWYFKRIQVESELPIVLLNSKIVSNETTETSENSSTSDLNGSLRKFTLKDNNRVSIKCMWDQFSNQDSQESLYRIWSYLNTPSSNFNPQNEQSRINQKQINPRSLKKFMHEITECIKNNDVAAPIRHLLRDRDKTKKYSYGIYREILFLSIFALGREHIDTDAFDREYRTASSALKPKTQELVKPFDRWPSNTSVWCRRLFSPLYL